MQFADLQQRCLRWPSIYAAIGTARQPGRTRLRWRRLSAAAVCTPSNRRYIFVGRPQPMDSRRSLKGGGEAEIWVSHFHVVENRYSYAELSGWFRIRKYGTGKSNRNHNDYASIRKLTGGISCQPAISVVLGNANAFLYQRRPILHPHVRDA